jgi:hypothetical protein
LPVILLALLAVSYFTRPASRRLMGHTYRVVPSLNDTMAQFKS